MLFIFLIRLLDAEMRLTKNGRQQLVYQEHTFNRHVSRANMTYWRCTQFAVFRCRARLKTQSNKTYVLNADHNHDVVREQRKYGALKEIKRKIFMENMQSVLKTQSKNDSTEALVECDRNESAMDS